MTRPVGEDEAWRLVLAVAPITPSSPGEAGSGRSVSVGGDGGSMIDLSVDSSGRWEAATPVSHEARKIFELFLPLRVRSGWVVGQVGQSLDGRIATATGDSHYVTGPEDRRRLHRLRALADAVLVGAGTVAADDPRLTVRGVEGRNPVRVVLDPTGRVDRSFRVWSDGLAPTLLIRRGGAAGARPPVGVDVLELAPEGDGRFDPHAVLEALEARGLSRVLVEGGGATVSGFVRERALDRLHVTVAPLLVGASGVPGLILDDVQRMADAIRPPCRRFALGEDVLFDLELARSARPAPGDQGPRPVTLPEAPEGRDVPPRG